MKDTFFKFLGITLLLITFSFVNCGGEAGCGGTETGNPTTCTTSNSPTTEDTGSTTDDASDSGDAGMGDTGDSSDSGDVGLDGASPESDNDLNVTPSLSDPFIKTLAYGGTDLDVETAALAYDNALDFAVFWEEFFGDAAAEIPDVDFSTHIVAAIIMGANETEYTVAFTKQHIENGTLILTITETHSAPGCVLDEGFLNPFHIISVPTAGEDIAIESKYIEKKCE